MNTMDDVFDESVEEEVIGEREWLKSKAELLKEGFRDGVAQGQESRLQNGFNTGYKLASVKLYQLAQLRGEISAILTSNYIQENKCLGETEVEQLNKLTEDISSLEKILLKPNKHQLQDILTVEGQGHMGKQNIGTFIQEDIIKSSVDDKMNNCGDGCGCEKNTEEQKCFHDISEATPVKGETIQSSGENPQNNDAEFKHRLGGEKSDNILLHHNFDTKIIEFRTRLKNIHKTPTI